MSQFELICFILTVLSYTINAGQIVQRTVDPLSWISAPQLSWSRGGCTPWCQTGWYSSPIYIPNPSNSNQNIVVGGAYSIRAVNAFNGEDVWNQEFNSTNRIWAGLVYKESFFNGIGVIIAARSSAQIVMLDTFGNIIINQTETFQDLLEFRSITIGQINKLLPTRWYIIAGQASYNDINLYVYGLDSYLNPTAFALQPGWPQNNDATYGGSHGIFNDNIGIIDLDDDGVDDIVAPSDVINICAYNYAAEAIAANTRYKTHDQTPQRNKTWGEISVYIDEQYDVQGWGPCSDGDPDPYRPNHAFKFHNSPVSTFKFQNKTVIVIPGNVDDCSTSPYTQLYYSLFVYNTDHSRVVMEQYDINWLWPPQWTGSPLSQNYNQIENIQPNVAIGDLDNDGFPEFVFSSYDGRIHCFSFKSKFREDVSYNVAAEPYYWPYAVTVADTIIFSSEPAIVDLDGDGIPEVIVVAWTQKDSNVDGELLILSYAGTLLASSALNMTENGALTAPTVGNIDPSDDLIEITFVTINGGLVMYKIPGTDINAANIIWGTGRGSFNRDGKCSVDYDGTPPFPNAELPAVTEPINVDGAAAYYPLRLLFCLLFCNVLM